MASNGDDDRQGPNALRSPQPRDIRVVSNQTTLRAINEAIEEGRQTGKGLIGFVCECGRLGCGVVLALGLEEYEHVRADARQFLVAPGHDTSDDQQVVAVEDRYTVVAKRGEEALAAQSTDPRGEGPALELIWSGGTTVAAISMRAEATPRSVGEVRHWVLAFAVEHGAGRELQARIAIAVAEAVSNAVVHAYEPDDDETIDVAVDVEDGDLEIVVADAGHGFRPGDPSGLGTGLPLIARTSDRFAIRERTPRGVEVWMGFALSRDAA
jgi:anti-sigma regulatory factor (Ser/Thr protein kinase)